MAGSKANGVLLFSGEEDVQRIVEGFLAAQILQNTNGPIQKLQQEPFAIYSLHDQIFLAPRVGGQIVVSKSRQQLEEVKEFLAGRAKGANRGEAFPGFAHVPNTFFFLAAAEGFNENPAIPPQAKILKMADAARIVLGEKGESIFLNLALKAKDPEIIQQIGQVLEGMKALVALGQSENKELLELVQSTKVATADKTVTVNIEYPISKVMSKLDGVSQHLQNALNDSTHGRPGKHKSRKSKKADSPEAEE